MQAVIIICCLVAFVFGYFALESDFNWNTYLSHGIRMEDQLTKHDDNDGFFYKRIYGMKETEYLLKRNIKFEKIVNIFLVVYLICSIIHLISCFLNKSVGHNRSLYEYFYTVSFFVLFIAMAMQFLSMHTYDVNYIQWEIRNGKNITEYNEGTGKFEEFYAKMYHPCTSESRLQMNEKDRLELETKFGPNTCQYYNAKLFVLTLLTISWAFSFLLIITVSNGKGQGRQPSNNKVAPEFVMDKAKVEEEEAEEELQKDNNDNFLEADEEADESISTRKHSSNSSCISINSNGNRNAERLLAKFRSELAVPDDDSM